MGAQLGNEVDVAYLRDTALLSQDYIQVNKDYTTVSGKTGGFVDMSDTFLVGWDDLGTVTNAQALVLKGALINDFGAPLVVDSVLGVILSTVATLDFTSSINMIEYKDTRQNNLTLEGTGIAGQLSTGSRIIRIDPSISDDTSVVFLGNAFSGGGLFDTSGTSDTFTAVSTGFLTSTTIDSVSSNVGIAQFNFTAGPAVYVGQEVTIVGFTTNTAYSITGVVSAASVGFFFAHLSKLVHIVHYIKTKRLYCHDKRNRFNLKPYCNFIPSKRA